METLRKLKIWLIKNNLWKIGEIFLLGCLIGIAFRFVFDKWLCLIFADIYKIIGSNFLIFLIVLTITILFYLLKNFESEVRSRSEDILFLLFVSIFFFQMPMKININWVFLLICCWFSSKKFKQVDSRSLKIQIGTKMQSALEDRAINTEIEDSLNRQGFVDSTLKIIDRLPLSGQKIILSGKWGEGKTSCINLLKSKIKEDLKKDEREDIYEFIELNPWFNDSKSQFLDSLLRQLNYFVENNEPFETLSCKRRQFLKLTSVNVGGLLTFEVPNKETVEDIVQDIGEVLSKYKKRIIVNIDDLDRLSKEEILYIIQIVQVFSEKTNIIFLLSIDMEKVEQILCEEGGKCLGVGNKKQASHYSGYIEKIASIILRLPTSHPEEIRSILLKELNKTLKTIHGDDVEKQDSFWLALKRFKNLRDVKRFLNAFSLSYTQVAGEVNVVDYFNLTVAHCFYPDIYKKIWEERYSWFKDVSKLNSDGEKKHALEYFDTILAEYKGEENIVLDLIDRITPTRYMLSRDNGSVGVFMPNKKKSFLKDSIIDERYFYLYFTHAFGSFRIPDKILEDKFEVWGKMDNLSLEKDIASFLNNNWESSVDFFDYVLRLTGEDKNKYKDLCKTIILSFARITKRQEHAFSISEKVLPLIPRIVNILYNYNHDNSFVFLKKIIEEMTSIPAAVHFFEYTDSFKFFETSLESKREEICQLLSEKFDQDILESLESLKQVNKAYFFYLYLQGFNTGKKEKSKWANIEEITNSMSNNFELFWTFIGHPLSINLSQLYGPTNEYPSITREGVNDLPFMRIIGKDNIYKMISAIKAGKISSENLGKLESLKSLLDKFFKEKDII